MFSFFELLGLTCVFIVVYQFAKKIFGIIYEFVIGPCFNSSLKFEQLGKWAGTLPFMNT